MRGFFTSRRIVYLQLSLAAGLAVAVVFAGDIGPVARAERAICAQFYRWRGPIEPRSSVIVAAIDDRSIEKWGAWPWPRSTFGKLLEQIEQHGAAAVGIDTTFSEDVAADDRVLRKRVYENRDIVLAYRFYRRRQDIPIEERAWATGEDSFDILAAQMIASISMPDSELPPMGGVRGLPRELRMRSGMLGFANFLPRDGALIGVPLVARYRTLLLPSLGLAVAARKMNFTPLVRRDADGKLSAVSIGRHHVPLQPDGRMIMRLTGPAGTYRRVSVADILEGELAEDAFNDAVVLVGPTVAEPDQRVATPFGSIPVVEVWANAVDAILSGDAVSGLVHAKAVTVGVIVGLALILGLLLPLVRIIPSLLVAAAMAAVVVADGYVFFVRNGVWLAVASPVIAIGFIFLVITVYRLTTVDRVRRRLAKAFGTSLGARSIDTVVENPTKLAMTGQRRQLTVLTLGVRRFSRVCEELDPPRLMRFMRALTGEVDARLHAQDGYVLQLGNGGVRAVFGAPVVRGDHARRACAAALEIRRLISKRAPAWKERYTIGSIKLRIGVETAPLVSGDIGSWPGHAFAVMGRGIAASDLFARLSATYRASIIVGSETVQASREWFVFRPLDIVRVRGFRRPVEIYELMSRRGVVTPYVDVYLRAYEAYHARRFDDALRYAEEILAQLPHDGPSLLIKSRARHFKEHPPDADWDGVWTL